MNPRAHGGRDRCIREIDLVLVVFVVRIVLMVLMVLMVLTVSYRYTVVRDTDGLARCRNC